MKALPSPFVIPSAADLSRRAVEGSAVRPGSHDKGPRSRTDSSRAGVDRGWLKIAQALASSRSQDLVGAQRQAAGDGYEFVAGSNALLTKAHLENATHCGNKRSAARQEDAVHLATAYA